MRKWFIEIESGGQKKWKNVNRVETLWEKSPWTQETLRVDGPAVVAFVDRAEVRTIAAAHFPVPAEDFYCIPQNQIDRLYSSCKVAQRGATGIGGEAT